MTQKQINTLYHITILIHEDEWFGKRVEKTKRDRQEVQEWVAKTLAESMGIYTVPSGSSWGVLTTEDRFREYWNEHSKTMSL